ncbi:reticulocyte-binding protein homolog 2a-like isoform X2 [Aphis gossypii]|uniref:reticulocyte-binding protein homolog 2a-like isoform X2 n=1 Tax=Aphis gossypii TaxID=80765 RepID=UPI002158CC8A|nr:reticulocyte-binding protein homolog 2a-like isoform X2 [Aphis gossypii]
MASSNTESPGTIYRWIEKKPLTEAVSWTSKEKFWLVVAIYHYGTHDWKKVAQVVRHIGESYRPQEWFSPTNCERQFKILVSNLSKEVKSLPFNDMMQHIAEGLKSDYKREINKSRDALKTKYCNLFNILNRVKQGNLSRSEIVNLYSQARRNEIEGKQYMEQLMTRQNASLASENSSSGLIEEPIKWNTPSAPLLTSLLRSRNTIPANRNATTISSLLQSPGGTSRTRSGKLLSLTPSIRTTQGTPTLSKLLEAPANPYIPNPPQATLKNKLTEVVAEKLVNTSRKENSQSTSLNKVRVDNMTTLGSFNQINKSDLSASKKQISKSPVSVVKSGSKANLNVVTLLSDSENDEDKNISLKSLFGDKKDTSNKVEPRATRSQTRAEGGFKQLNDTKLSDGKKDRESLRQQSGGSLINEQHSIDDVIADIDQIEVQPLSSVQDEIQTQTPSKMTRSSLQKLRLSSPGDNSLTNNKVNTKDISNKMIEEISANFVLSASPKTIPPQYQCLLTKPRNNTSDCLNSIDRIAVKDAILLRKESQSLQNTLNTSDRKQEGVIEINASSVIGSRNDSKVLSLNNQPVLVVNKIKKPFNIKLTSEQRVDDNQVTNTDLKKSVRLNNSSQNVVKLTDKNCTATAAANDDDDDDIIILDDEIFIDDNNKTSIKTKELSSNIESQNVSSIVVSPNINISSNSKSTLLQLDEKKNKNDKTPWNMFGKPQNILDSTKKHCHQDNVSKSRTNSNISETNSQFIKELDFDFDQSISQTSLAELYNGVEEIVEMHSFDNEELNSLIECGSLDSNETEERRNTVSVDQGDSSVSESDSTIGAFDTFAQITRVRQRSSTPKDIKLDTKELKITNQGIKNFKESFCQSDKTENDQSSVVSVTGIPILQGVISDVMNQIDLDSVASLTTSKSLSSPSNDVVELMSSDEEATVKHLKAHPLNIQNKKIQTQNKEKEGKSYKLKEVELIKLHDTETKVLKDNNINCGISNIQPIQIELPSCFTVKNPIPDSGKLTVGQILEIKKEATEDNEMVYYEYSNPDEIIDINEFDDDDEMEPKGIAVKIANEKLLKETERMRKEAKENEERMKNEEERKRKEDERLKKEEDERRKKENDDRMKKENEEKKKIEDLKEFEKMLINEKKKIEEEEDSKKKEQYKRKIIDIQKAIKIEKEQKQEGKTLKERYEEERQKRGNLAEFDSTMRKEFKVGMGNSVVVNEEEIINKCVILEEIVVKDCFIEDTYLGEIKARKDTPKIILQPKNILKCPTESDQIRGIELQSKEESPKKLIALKECKRIEDLINQNKTSSVSDVPGQNEYNRIPIPTKTNQLEIQTKEAKEDEKQRVIEAKLQRLKEAEVQKVKEAEKQGANEIISRAIKEAEIGRVKAAELERFKNERIKRAEEVETKKSKEAELRKNITVKETEIKGLEKRNVLKKVNETGNNQSVGPTEVKSVKNPFKKKNEGFQNEAIIDQLFIETSKAPMEHKKSLIETRKVTAKEDVETINLRERGIRKCIGLDGKTIKVIEPKSSEVKMITRMRGVKVEELDAIKIASCSKLRPQLILERSPLPSIASSNSVENLSISCHEYKKQTKITDDGNKRNSTSNIPNDKKHYRDLNAGSCVSVKKDNFNYEALGTPRTRTRSSSFKQKTISETKSSKQSQDNGAAIISKETIKKKFLNNDNADICPVVLLDSMDIITQRPTDLAKQQQNKQVHNQVQKPAETNIQLQKPPPKKRGRKRRIDVQNEKLQETPKSNKQTPKNCGKTRILEKEIEPLAKRTRRSLGLRNIKQESMSKQSIQPRKFKKQHVNKAIESIKTKKKVLQFVFNNLCERSKYILSLDKKIKNLPPKCLDIVKFPIKLKEIKKKITTGKIKNINELQFNLVMWSYNAQMIKRSDNIVFSEASNFQYELEEYCRSLKNAVNDQNVDKYQKEKNRFLIHGNDLFNLRYSGAKKDSNDARITVNKETIANIYKYIDNSCDESSGSESDSYMPPKKKRKKNISDFSNSESD